MPAQAPPDTIPQRRQTAALWVHIPPAEAAHGRPGVIPVLRPVPLLCAQTLARVAAERKWVVAVYLVTIYISLPALVIGLVGVL